MAADTQGMDVDGGAGGKLVEPSLCCDANDTRKSQNQCPRGKGLVQKGALHLIQSEASKTKLHSLVS